MNHIDQNTLLTDQLERQLIRQEISRQMSFAPAISFKPILDKLAAMLGYVRSDNTLNSPYATR